MLVGTWGDGVTGGGGGGECVEVDGVVCVCVCVCAVEGRHIVCLV